MRLVYGCGIAEIGLGRMILPFLCFAYPNAPGVQGVPGDEGEEFRENEGVHGELLKTEDEGGRED
jgi:hypothetical protein